MVDFNNNDPRVVSGMSVQVEVVSRILKNVLFVPIEAVFEENGKLLVYKVTLTGPEKVFIKINESNNNYVEVTEGLRRATTSISIVPSRPPPTDPVTTMPEQKKERKRENLREALHLEDIRKAYHTGSGDVPVLKGINYDIWRGEFIGIMGTSGSGKSTMLNILGLLDKPTGGLYRLDGIDVSRMSDYELTRVRNIKIGFVFQAFNLFPHLTVQENIEVPMLYAEVPAKKRHEISAYMAERVRLGHRLDHRPNQLSGGECSEWRSPAPS